MPNSFTTGHIVTAAEYDADVSRFGAWASGTKSSSVTTTGTTFAAGADLLASALTFTADGTSSYLLTVAAAGISNNTASDGADVHINLDGSDLGSIARLLNTASTAAMTVPLFAKGVIVTPSAGSHTVNARLVAVLGGTATVTAGTGAGSFSPLLVSVAVI